MAAHFCTHEGPTDCKVQAPATIVQTSARHYNKGDHYFVSLLRTDGTRLPDVEMGTGYSTWVTLTPFTPVTAIYWHGTLAAVMTQVPPAVRTVDHPVYRSDENKRRAIYSWLAAIVMVILYVIARQFPSRSRRGTLAC
jgi:hypothetical protein